MVCMMGGSREGCVGRGLRGCLLWFKMGRAIGHKGVGG